MRKYLIPMMMSIMLISILSCKDTSNTENPIKDTLKSKIDSTKTKQEIINFRKKISNYSLDSLLILYNQTNKLESSNSKLFLQAIRDEIYDDREIKEPVYNDLMNKFWGSNILITKKITLQEVNSMIKGAKITDYIKFEFDSKKDNVFIDKIVPNHNFDNNKSCFPALIFMKMTKDPKFKLLEVVKGTKTLTNPPSNYNGIYNMAVLKYSDTNSKIQYFDIVEDPSIDYKGFNP